MAAKQGTIFKCLSEASCSLQRSCYVSPLALSLSLSLFLSLFLSLSLFLLPMHSPENTRRWGTYITVRLVSSFTSLDSTAFLHTTIFFFGQIQSCYKLETSGQSYKHFTIVNYNSRVVMCANCSRYNYRVVNYDRVILPFRLVFSAQSHVLTQFAFSLSITHTHTLSLFISSS